MCVCDVRVENSVDRGSFHVCVDVSVRVCFGLWLRLAGDHTLYLSFFLHGQNFWRIKFTPKNANISR